MMVFKLPWLLLKLPFLFVCWVFRSVRTLCTKTFWLSAWEARKVHEYGPKELAIWALSGLQTTATNAIVATTVAYWTSISGFFTTVGGLVAKAWMVGVAVGQTFIELYIKVHF